MRKKSSVLVLNKYIKAYEKKVKIDDTLNAIKEEALSYLLENETKLSYKKYKVAIQYSTTYDYTHLANEMKEALVRQKKIEELNGDAVVRTSTPYIKLTKNKD